MSTNWTPGPWLPGVTGKVMQGYSQPFCVVSRDHKNLICGCFGDGIGAVQAAEANANLIAAAPELYEALEYLIETASEHIPIVQMNKAIKLLAKARGETP